MGRDMNRAAYDTYFSTRLTVRDQLAIERTALANERTYLSYLRTMFGMVAIGVTLMELADSWFVKVAAVGLILAAVLVFVLGFKKYAKSMSFLYRLEHQDPSYPEVTFSDYVKNLGKSFLNL